MKDVPWHSIPVEETLQKLQTSSKTGLDPAEVEKRLATVGLNVLTPPPSVPAWRRFLAQFENPLIIILLVSAGACILVGRVTDALTILAVTIVNAVIGFIQEQNAQKAIDALAKMVKTECHVFRGSDIPIRIDAEGLVPGDIIILTSGDRVPADLRIIDSKNLQINESALTGESLPATKTTAAVSEDAGLGDRKCLGFSGALVTGGSGIGVVVATGDATQIGLINAMMNQTEEIDTPLMRRLEKFSSVFGFWVIGFSLTLLAIGIYHVMQNTVAPFIPEEPARKEVFNLFQMLQTMTVTQIGVFPGGVAVLQVMTLAGDFSEITFRIKIVEVFMAAVSAAVGAIPEGLPAVMTIVLAIGTKNMAARKAIIRKLPAVETLGSVTVICSDKTGTLTANEMTVQRILAGGKGFNLDGVGFNPAMGKIYGPDGCEVQADLDLQRILTAGVLCSDSRLRRTENGVVVDGDPTEGALLTAAHKGGLVTEELRRSCPRQDVVPFDSARQMMLSLHPEGPGKYRLWVKGSVEAILPWCSGVLYGDAEVPLDRHAIGIQVDEAAGLGMRVLAFATSILKEDAIPEHLPKLSFLGLQAMIDPPRPEVRESLAICRSAGIQVKMITGDHLATANAIARDLGISQPGVEGVSGKQLAQTSNADLVAVAEGASVFARVAPEHKFRLVEALQKKGHVVAMTGDGVNDAPALKRADIGVAMGMAGTDVAKEAADMVLVDDNFATLVRAVEEGRNVFNNLVKSMVYILPTNTAQGLVLLVAVLIGMRLPITPVQVLWVNLLTAFLSLPMAFEAMEPGLMKRAPRHPDAPLMDRRLILRISLVALVMTLLSFVIYWYERQLGSDIARARTAVTATMVCVEFFYLFPSRALWAPMPGLSPTLNPVLWPCLLATVALQLAFTYVPVFQNLMESRPIDLQAWLVILAVSATVIPLIEILKRWTGTDGETGRA